MTLRFLSFLLGGLLFMSCIIAGMAQGQERDSSVSAAEVPSASGSTFTFSPKFFRVLDASQLEKLKTAPSVGAVYFYKQNLQGRLHTFLSEYDKSAGFLSAYGLTLGLVDCSGSVTDDLQRSCAEAEDQKIYTYRNGASVLDLDLETMFDVNSIMSNILQLALLDEVSIIQNKKARQLMEHENAGQTDIIYCYHNAIGTYEHRVFMEIAYAYQDKYKFVVTTEPSSVVDLQDSHMMSENSVCEMWVLHCKDRYSAATGCRSVNYRGEFNLVALATFFKQLSWPKLYLQSESSTETHPCEASDDTVCVYVFHSVATKDAAYAVIDSIQFDLHGMAGLIVQQIDNEGATGSGIQDPQVTIRKQGGTYLVMEDSWQLDRVEHFLSSHLFSSPENDKGNLAETTEEDDDERSEPDAIDDMVVHVAYKQQETLGQTPDVPSLTDKTFPATVYDSNNKLVVVLFYIPFDSVGMLFLGPYQEVGRQLAAMKGDDPSAHPLVSVNCYDWMDVCQKENITTYPVIHYYRQGGKRQQYRHALDTDVLLQTVMLLQAEQPLTLTSDLAVDSFLAGDMPDQSYQAIDNFVLLKQTKEQKEMEAYTAVVKALETQMLFAIVGPDVKTDLVPSGGVVHSRPRDSDQSMDTLTEGLDTDTILAFLLKRQFHLFPELTFVNFPTLFARKQPFGILFFDPSDPKAADVQGAVVNIIKSADVPDLTFCKMSMDGSNTVAAPLLDSYTETVQLPTFAIVNHQQGEVFVKQSEQLTETDLLSWIQDVQKGTVSPSKVLEKGEWKPPGRHYDFLAKIDQEENLRKKRTERPSSIDCQSEDCDRMVGNTVTVNLNRKETEEQDNDIRSTLLELHKSRLYKPTHHSPAPASATDAQTTTATVSQGGKGVPQHTEL